MPIHDWRRVVSGIFHDFHQAWITEISNALNGGLLPTDNYAMAEQVAGGPHPDVLTLETLPESEPADDEPFDFRSGGTALVTAIAEHPLLFKYTREAEEAIYAAKANRIAVYHASGDRVIAFLEIISPGNKHSEGAVRQLISKLSRALAQGRHLVVIDLFPPGRHDPDGLHAEIWGKPDPALDPEEPLLLAAYRATASPVSYIEPTAVGRTLVDAPLFLTNEHYINIPLEQTYMAAWKGFPDRWKRVIEPSTAPRE